MGLLESILLLLESNFKVVREVEEGFLAGLGLLQLLLELRFLLELSFLIGIDLFGLK